MSDRTVTIAGKTHELRFLLNDRREIEAACAGRALLNIMGSGAIEDQATVVWAGLRHANRKLTPRAVIDLFQKHQDQGGDYYQDVVKVAYLAALVDGHLIGQQDEKAVLRAFDLEVADDAGATGKGAGDTVKAQE